MFSNHMNTIQKIKLKNNTIQISSKELNQTAVVASTTVF